MNPWEMDWAGQPPASLKPWEMDWGFGASAEPPKPWEMDWGPEAVGTQSQDSDSTWAKTSFTDRVVNPLQAGALNLRQGAAGLGADMSGRSLTVMDRIDRGETVPETEDPVGYQHMTPEQRADARRQAEADIGRSARIVAETGRQIEAIPQNPSAQRMLGAKTWGEAWGAFTEDPLGVIASVGLQSLPAMAPGLAAGVVGGPLAGAIGMGASSGGSEFMAAVLEGMAAEGVDIRDPAAVERAVRDQGLMGRVRDRAATRAGLIGTVDAVTGGLAGKTVLAPAALKSEVARQAVNVPVQMGAQAAAGAGAEAGAQITTEGRITEPGKVLGEAVGEAFGAPAEVLALRGHRAPAEAATGATPAPGPGWTPFLDERGRPMGWQSPDGGTFVPFRGQAAPMVSGPDGRPAEVAPPNVTPEDVASPIDTGLISEGRALVDELLGGQPQQPAPVADLPTGAVPAEVLLGRVEAPAAAPAPVEAMPPRPVVDQQDGGAAAAARAVETKAPQQVDQQDEPTPAAPPPPAMPTTEPALPDAAPVPSAATPPATAIPPAVEPAAAPSQPLPEAVVRQDANPPSPAPAQQPPAPEPIPPSRYNLTLPAVQEAMRGRWLHRIPEQEQVAIANRFGMSVDEFSRALDDVGYQAAPIRPEAPAAAPAAQASAPTTAPQTPAPILRKDGTPFGTEKSAALAARQRPDLKGRALEPAPVDGGWGLREVGEVPAPAPAAEAPPAQVVAPRRRPTSTRPATLFEFLASRGGIQDQGGELRARDLHNRFIPGYGRLVRRKGMTLDEARAAAEEAGYLRPSDRTEAFGRTEIADLLEAIDREGRGRRVVPIDEQADVARQSQDQRRSDEESSVRAGAEAEVSALMAEHGIALPDEFQREAVEAAMLGADPADAVASAFERWAIQTEGAIVAVPGHDNFEIPFEGLADAQQQGIPGDRERVPQGDADGAAPAGGRPTGGDGGVAERRGDGPAGGEPPAQDRGRADRVAPTVERQSDEPNDTLIAAGFKQVMSGEWARTVPGDERTLRFNVRHAGDPRSFIVRLSIAFPGGVTGAPTQEIGRFATPAEAVDAIERQIALRAPASSRTAPAVERTDQGDQLVLPGGERSARQAAQAREDEGRGKLQPKRPQRAADEGLFAPAGGLEPELFDRPPSTPRPERRTMLVYDDMPADAHPAAVAKNELRRWINSLSADDYRRLDGRYGQDQAGFGFPNDATQTMEPERVRAEWEGFLQTGRSFAAPGERETDRLQIGEDPAAFIPGPDGSLDFGEIDREAAAAIGRQPGKIRLRQGDATQGLVHIEASHADDMARRGYRSVVDLVADVAGNYDEIHKGGGRALILVKRDGRQSGAAWVQLEPASDGDFYDVRTATPARDTFLSNRSPAWRRSAQRDATDSSGGVATSSAPFERKGPAGEDNVSPREDDGNGSLRLAPAFEQALPAIEADLRARLERFGIADRVAVRFVDAIRTRRPIEADGEVIPAGTPIPFATGRYHQRLIEVALASRDRMQTFGHEAIHALRDIGVFRDAEWRTLDRAARADKGLMADIRRRYEGMPLTEDELVEEAVAEMFGDWLSGRSQARGFLRTAFERIRDFIRALGQALRGQGFRTYEAVFRSIERGEIGGRREEGRGAVAAAFQTAWHGSPHDFDRFTTNAIGKGEGAQAYGWGIYFAGKKGIAEWYRENLSGGSEATDLFSDSAIDIIASVEEFAPRDALAQYSERQAKSLYDRWGGDDAVFTDREMAVIYAWLAVSDWVEGYESKRNRRDLWDLATGRKTIDELTSEGRLYKVEIPDDDSYLLWDKPLSEQSESVKNAARIVAGAYGLAGLNMGMRGRSFYKLLSEVAGSDRSASMAFRGAGVPGIKYLDGSSRAAGDGSFNYVIFDDADISIQEKLQLQPRDTDPNTPGAAQARQRVALFEAIRQPLDRAARIPFDLFGGLDAKGQWKPGLYLSDRAAKLITEAEFDDAGPFSWVNTGLRKARAGLIDRYGLDPAYVERERRRGLDERSIAARVPEILERLKGQGVAPEEMATLHAVLTGEEVADARWQGIAAPIRDAIDQMGAEAVSLGLLSAESYERNRGKYLHRVYLKHETDQGRLAAWVSRLMSGRRRKIIGDQFKGRGMWLEVDPAALMKAVPGFKDAERGGPVKGERFVMLDQLEDTGQGALDGIDPGGRRKVLDRAFLPADRDTPSAYSGYENRGTWEVRGTKGGKVVLWRDFTKAERRQMGEIVDARYTVAKTFLMMAHDLATGRFFQDIAANEAWSRSDAPPEGAWKEAGEYSRFWEDPAVKWVRVPDATIPKSNTKRYGALAGRYVRAEIWRDLAELEAMQKPGWWDTLLRQWKLNKTARSPVVHMNNVMSNLMFMDMADVRGGDLVSAIRSMVRQDAAYREAVENGAFGTDMVAAELRRDVLRPVLEEITRQGQGGQGALEARLGVLGKLADRLFSGLKTADDAMLRAYQMEDEVFRMALFVRRREQGASAEQAALEARDQFMNYDIRAPWVNAARRTVLPFASYTYRAVPIVAKTAATRPWKMAKYATVAYATQALAYALMGDDEDEQDRQRRSLRQQEQGHTWIGTERMLRLPANDSLGNPLYLDIRRWIPAGDVFDLGQGSSVVPLPSWLQMGGPLQIGMELMLNRSAFTGRDIVNRYTDDTGDRLTKAVDYLYKAWMPSAAYIPGSWYWERVGNAIEGARDWQGRPYSVPQALASSVGVKVKPQDVEEGFYFWGREFDRTERELRDEARRAGRDRERGLISEKAYERAMERNMEKLEQLGERRRETFTGTSGR